MAHVFRINNSEIFAKHQQNIAVSLSHRLEVARANHNTQLINLLEQEQRQLGLGGAYDHHVSAIANWVKSSWNNLLDVIDKSTHLSVEQVKDANGATWWHAFDPQSGKALYAESESEVVQWIEDNRLGQ